MFRTVPLSIIRSFSLYTQQWYMSHRFANSSQAVSKPVWHIPLLCVQWKTPDDGQRNCPKHVGFYSRNKFEKLVHLVGFIIRIFHDAQSPERQILVSVPYILTMIMWRRRRRRMVGFKSWTHPRSQVDIQWLTLRARVQAKERSANEFHLCQSASRNFAT